MQTRLESFPPDLEDFFKHMLNDIPLFYRSKTAQLFRIAMTVEASLPLMVHSFVDERNRGFTASAEGIPMSEREITRRKEQLEKRLDGRSKGFLEVVELTYKPNYFRYEVDFLHRTVRDFLYTSREVNDMFSASLPETFDATEILCTAYLAFLQFVPRHELLTFTKSENLGAIIEGLFHFTSQAEQFGRHKSFLGPLLDSVRNHRRLGGRYPSPETESGAGFLACAIQAGLVSHVDRVIRTVRITPRLPFLHYALELPWQKKTFPGQWKLSPKMIRLLLDRGEDPNAPIGTATVWTKFLAVLWARQNPSSKLKHSDDDSILETMKILVIKGGARLFDYVHHPSGSEKENQYAYDVVRTLAPKLVVDFISAYASEKAGGVGRSAHSHPGA
jgi:hypothetical protein